MYAIRYKELVKKDEGINNNMAKKRDKKNKLRGKWLRGIIIVYLLLILCNLFHEFPSRLGNLHSIPVSEEWYLIVVNRWNESKHSTTSTLSSYHTFETILLIS